MKYKYSLLRFILFFLLPLFSYAQNPVLSLYTNDDAVIHYTGYSLSYSEEHEQAK